MDARNGSSRRRTSPARANGGANGDVNGAANRRAHGLYRLNSNQSSSSVFEDVEMAHDEVRGLG